MKDPVISVKDLLATCVKKARIIMILAVVFGVALCGFKYLQDVETQKQLAQAKEETQTTELTEEELEEVDEYIDAVLLRDEIANYIDNSIYMNCNPYALNYVELEYNIQSASKDTEVDATLALRNYVLSGMASDMNELDDSLGIELYREIITVESIDYDSYLDSGVLKIKLHASNEKQAEEFGKLVGEAVSAHVKSLQNKGMDFTATKLYETVTCEMSVMLVNTQNEYKNILKSYETNADNLKNALSAAQLKEASNILEIEEHIKEEIVVEPASMSPLFLIVGAILGIAVGVVLIAIKYIFTNTIKTVLDIQNMFGVHNLGHLTCKKLTFWDKLANKIFYSKDDFDLENEKKQIVSKIKVYCKKNEINRLVLAFSENEVSKNQVEDLSVALKDCNITCEVLDKNVVEAFETVENVIMTGKIGQTNFEAIENELLFYKSQEIHVLGYIAVI